MVAVYYAYLNFIVWVICALYILDIFHNELDNLWFMCSLENYLSTYVNLCLDVLVSCCPCSLLIKMCRLQMVQSCVADGVPDSQYGIECAA